MPRYPSEGFYNLSCKIQYNSLQISNPPILRIRFIPSPTLNNEMSSALKFCNMTEVKHITNEAEGKEC